MGSQSILETYVYACAGGELPLPECAPLWQFGIIAVLLVSAIAALLVLRIRFSAESAQETVHS
jgi:hypothetical protein